MTNATTTSTDTESIDLVDLDAVIDGYLACWITADAGERADLVARHWTPDARMSDPLFDVSGHAGLIGIFAHFHDAYPGCAFRRVGGHAAHHDTARWAWEMIGPDGAIVLAGTDVATLADDGRLDRVIGFFDPVAA